MNELQGRIEQAIRAAVADPSLADTIIRKVALHAADGLLSRSDLRQSLDELAEGRRAGTIRVPGAYFVAVAKRLYQQAGLPWLNKHLAPGRSRDRQRGSA